MKKQVRTSLVLLCVLMLCERSFAQSPDSTDLKYFDPYYKAKTPELWRISKKFDVGLSIQYDNTRLNKNEALGLVAGFIGICVAVKLYKDRSKKRKKNTR